MSEFDSLTALPHTNLDGESAWRALAWMGEAGGVERVGVRKAVGE